jgi:hypothetical protein
MHEHKISEVKFHNIPVIDARLAELDLEKQQLIALKETLQKTPPNSLISDSFSLQQKVAIFSNLFRGRREFVTNHESNARIATIENLPNLMIRSSIVTLLVNKWLVCTLCSMIILAIF